MWKIFDKNGVFVAHPDFADANLFASKLAAHGFGWCAIYAMEGTQEQNASWLAGHDWFSALRANGVRPGIWGFLEEDPVGEAQLADALISKYDGPAHDVFFIADAEASYKADTGGDRTRSGKFVNEFRRLRPTRVAALSSYGAAVWDNLLGSVFDYGPWQNNLFDFMPQAYFNETGEYEPGHCVQQALANGWRAVDIHPTVSSYDGALGRINGDQYSYILRTLNARYMTTGFSVFNAENMTDADFDAYSRLAQT